MPVRVSAWAIYDVFEVRDGAQVFVGVVSDAQWQTFCSVFEFSALGNDARYRTNRQRIAERDAILAVVRERFALLSQDELLARLESAGLPFAPIARPEDLFHDPHLNAAGGLGETLLPDGRLTRLPILPLEFSAGRPTQGGSLAKAGEHTRQVLSGLGVCDAEAAELQTAQVI
jgi:crotonobetainyl-CoA:carnitine CoA-transferase CaiB-like acyl-CoA transferase